MNDDEAKIVGLSPVSFEISTHHIDANGAFAGVSRVGRFGAKKLSRGVDAKYGAASPTSGRQLAVNMQMIGMVDNVDDEKTAIPPRNLVNKAKGTELRVHPF